MPVVFREDRISRRASSSATPVLLASLSALLLFCALAYVICCRQKPDGGPRAAVGLPVATGVAVPTSQITVDDPLVGVPVTGVALAQLVRRGTSSVVASGQPATSAGDAASGGDELAHALRAAERGPVSGVRVVGGVVGGREPAHQADVPRELPREHHSADVVVAVATVTHV